MRRNGKLAEVKLKEVLLADKKIAPFGFMEVLRCDLAYVLESYFDVDKANFRVDIETTDSGKYKITCEGSADAVKPFRLVK